MKDFENLCERVNGIFKQYNSPGIEAIGENAEFFVFDQASEIEGEVEYGPTPLLCNKSTGEFRRIDFSNEEDRKLLYTFKAIDVPEKFRPIYK